MLPLIGSQWRKWDLHIHTPTSYLNNNFGDNWDNYVQILFKKAMEKQIFAIGVTDYFTIEGYKKIKNDYLSNEGKLRKLFNESEILFIKNILILPNIEFRLNKFVGNKSINFHVIFSDEVEIRDIEEHFLHELNFVYEGNPQNTDESRKLKITNLIELGKRLKEQHDKFRDRSDSCIGMMNAVVDDTEITNILERQPSKFKGNYLLGVDSDEDLSKINWDSRDHQTRKVLIQKSDFLLSSNDKTIQWALGENPYKEGVKSFINEFKSLKPCIHGSDAHSFSEIAHPCSKRSRNDHDCSKNSDQCDLKYCWIKADLTFEGLKQIVYEPKLRIRIQSDNPEESETYAKILKATIKLPEKLKIKDETGEQVDFCVNGKYDLAFSNNLTCIIGGRGSGKSTLIHLLYNSWINQDLKKLNEINSPLINLDIEPNPLKKISEFTSSDIPSKTEFFFQNEIELSAKNIESMSSLINHRLDKLSLINGEKSLKELEDDWSNSLEAMDKQINYYDKISEICETISKTKDEIFTLKKQTEIITSKEYKKFQTNIGEIAEKISNFETYEKEYIKTSQEINSIIISLAKLEWSKEQGITVIKNIVDFLKQHKNELEQYFIKFKENYKKSSYDQLLLSKKQELKKYLKSKGISQENIEELTDANQKIKHLENHIKDLEAEKQPFADFYKEKKKTIDDFKNSYHLYKQRYAEVISLLEEKLAGLAISNKEIKFSLISDFAKLKQRIVEFIKEFLKDDKGIKSDVIENLLFQNRNISKYAEDKINIREMFNKITGAEKHRQLLQELINDDIFLEKIHLRILKEFYYINNIQVQTKLGGKLLKNTSFGERCGIVISIILAAGTNPIIVDQPEDHLDGKFISDVLVPLLRKQKINRQIILITRDANIVIGGDAELIQILETNENRTEVYFSSIENRKYRDKYIWILDGGEEAFSKREQKYNIGLYS